MVRKIWAIAVSCVLLLALSAVGVTALAGGGAEVWVNNVRLDSASPYWKNGGASASAGDWNAYFDAATNTLTLKDAVITESHTPYGALIYANDALNLVLGGANSITRTDAVSASLFGIYAKGTLVITGDGSLGILLKGTAGHSNVSGMISDDTITVNSGSLSVNLDGYTAYGIGAAFGVVIAGGKIDMETSGSDESSLLYMTNANFRMSGGTFRGTAASDNGAAGVVAPGVVLTGGEGRFYAQSPGFAVGMFTTGSGLHVSGGHFIFAGDTYALIDYFVVSGALDLQLTNVKTYVSETADSFAKRLWASDADGHLVSYATNVSPFLYVEFVGGVAVAPQTGDSSMPLLWTGIALCALLCAAGLTAAGRGRAERR